MSSAGFSEVTVTEHTIEARFPGGPDTFIRNMELAYAAVIPQFVEDPAAFDEHVRVVEVEADPLVRGLQEGDDVVVPMHMWVAMAR